MFEIYLRQPELPHYQTSMEDNIFTLEWIVPGNIDFQMPTEIKIDGNIKRFIPENGVISFEVNPDSELLVDPRNQILKGDSD
jgi:hypothetical protein